MFYFGIILDLQKSCSDGRGRCCIYSSFVHRGKAHPALPCVNISHDWDTFVTTKKPTQAQHWQ